MTRVYDVSVRDDSGWEPTTYPLSVTLDALEGERRLVIFIHGFATSIRKANRAYHRMIAHIADQGWGYHPPSTSYVLFHWPGNHLVPGLNQLTYSSRIGNARMSGEILGDALYRSDCEEVLLVAHSLGSRVALTALRHLKDSRARHGVHGPRVSVAILMAAAVPARECESIEGFPRGRLDADRYVVLHSQLDDVLLLAFQPGQFIYRAKVGRAVGRFGEPEGRWDRKEQMFFGHSDYWERLESASVVAEELGVSASAPQLSILATASATLPYLDLPEADPF